MLREGPVPGSPFQDSALRAGEGREPHSLHALRGLAGDVDQLEHLELGLLHVQMFVEAAALTPLCDNGQVVLGHVAHEEQDVHVPGLPEGGAPKEISGCSQNSDFSKCIPGWMDCIFRILCQYLSEAQAYKSLKYTTAAFFEKLFSPGLLFFSYDTPF